MFGEMKLGFHGHTRTLVLNYTIDGEYHHIAMPSGMRLMRMNADASAAGDGNYTTSTTDFDTDEFRRDYYELHKYDKYYAVSRYLGYKKGTTPNNILSVFPEGNDGDEDGDMDILYVWDEGYGGLEVPKNCKNVFWASEKAVPDKEQFEAIADKTTLMLDAAVLRRAGAMISRQISWERTASEFISELQTNPNISHLRHAKYIFVTFDLDGGVFLINKGAEGYDAALILTHGGTEGALKEEAQGELINAFELMALTFAQRVSLLFNENLPSFEEMPIPSDDDRMGQTLYYIMGAVSKGSAVAIGGLLQQLLEIGEAVAQTGFRISHDKKDLDLSVGITPKEWQAFQIPLTPQNNLHIVPQDWIITANIANKQMLDVAHDYVINGAKVIEGLPQLTMGNLTTVDRWEIESYQNIRNLILGYAAGDSVRPLSIAVFGSPGSGKSFGVTEIAKNILPGKVEKLEFNVSQFISPQDLASAFQKVRDVILMGKLPLVFFDEFDSDKDGVALGWVKSFLMPMQDGRFRDGEGEHPLGKCILVFAGGTAVDFDTFASPMNCDCEETRQQFKNIKGPDFLSRLRGTISILGPNPKDEHDKNYILRRALLLRSLCIRKLGTTKDGKAPVADGIIRAMLTVPEFRHGARSMEAILDMSRIEGGKWEPAALPFHSQLALHVDADEFVQAVKM